MSQLFLDRSLLAVLDIEDNLILKFLTGIAIYIEFINHKSSYESAKLHAEIFIEKMHTLYNSSLEVNNPIV